MGRGRRTLLGGALLLAGAPLPTASFIASRRVASSTHAAVRLHISPPGTRTEEERIEATIEAGEAWNSDKKGGWTDSRGTWFPNRIQEVLTMDDIVWVRPGGGIAPGNEADVLSKRLTTPVAAGSMILPDHLAEG